MAKEYINYKGHMFTTDTDPKLFDVLIGLEHSGIRCRFFWGDKGQVYDDSNDIMGYVGASRGRDGLYPLLVKKSNSTGGGALLTCIIACIMNTKTHEVIYSAKGFKFPVYGYVQRADGLFDVFRKDGKPENPVVARVNKLSEAEKFVEYMEGKRFSYC